MEATNHTVTAIIKPTHSKGKKVTRSGLDRRLKDRGSNQLVTPPLPSESVLTEDSYADLFAPPGSQLVLDFGLLPTDKPSAG